MKLTIFNVVFFLLTIPFCFGVWGIVFKCLKPLSLLKSLELIFTTSIIVCTLHKPSQWFSRLFFNSLNFLNASYYVSLNTHQSWVIIYKVMKYSSSLCALTLMGSYTFEWIIFKTSLDFQFFSNAPFVISIWTQGLQMSKFIYLILVKPSTCSEHFTTISVSKTLSAKHKHQCTMTPKA